MEEELATKQWRNKVFKVKAVDVVVAKVKDCEAPEPVIYTETVDDSVGVIS